MNSEYGSEWRKWDFHVHTPYSSLNNQYGINPYEENCDFDSFVIQLFTKAVEKNIAAIGITDYFMLEGYKRIRNEYLSKPEKMKACFPDDALRHKVEQILVFPNIEFRINLFVGKEAHSVNYHVIFSDKLPVRVIEDNFLHMLTISEDATKSLTIANIESIGKMVKDFSGDHGSDLHVGLTKITVNPRDILDRLRKNSTFTNQFLITIPVDEDLSKIPWTGRDGLSRKDLYQQCDCYMTANKGTRMFALAEGEEDVRKRDFGSIKPCIWGSDAHDYARMFEPAEQRYCWIKADTTFEGLLQILYEPADRVRIQKDKPDGKDPHQIIDSVTFDDERFQPQPIFFNDNLTCIIGGKSTGKSLLLRQLAAAIDPQHVLEREKSVGIRGGFQYPRATVRWKDGTADSRKIVYIPQTFLNRSVDNQEQSTDITQIVEKVLQQVPAIAAAHEDLTTTTRRLGDSFKSDISKYCATASDLKQLQQTILREGSSSTYQATVDKLEAARAELAEKSNVSQAEIDRYAELEKQILQLRGVQTSIRSEIQSLDKLQKPTVVVPGHFEITEGLTVQHDFGLYFGRCADQIHQTIAEMTAKVQPDWLKMCEHLKNELTKDFTQTSVTLIDAEREFSILKEKVERNDQLQLIAHQITEEKKRLAEAIEREEEHARLQCRAEEIKKRIISSQKAYFDAYTLYSNAVKSSGGVSDTALKFDAQVVWKKNDFANIMSSIFDNRNFSSFRNHTGYDLQSLEKDDYGTEFLTALWDAINGKSAGGLMLKSAFSVESAMNNIFRDWYNIHYVVISGADTIEQMSPGKKALVLLELLINLEKNKCPILIDQPEDDLDNRSIYYDLVQFIRKKKLDRQIIVVTHNANVVLGADAEEVIVANQNGHDTPNAYYRFEYRSGSIESDSIECDSSGNPLSGVLNRSGIQTQICDILEGGKVAFELRRNKYSATPNQ